VPDPPDGDARTNLLDQVLHVLRLARGDRASPWFGSVQLIQRFTAGTEGLAAQGRPTQYARVFQYQEAPVQTSVSARLGGRIARLGLDGEIAAVVNARAWDRWILPRIGWSPRPSLRLSVGASWLSGDELSPFGRNHERSAVYTEGLVRF
jgi:hypothetical protein